MAAHRKVGQEVGQPNICDLLNQTPPVLFAVFQTDTHSKTLTKHTHRISSPTIYARTHAAIFAHVHLGSLCWVSDDDDDGRSGGSRSIRK